MVSETARHGAWPPGGPSRTIQVGKLGQTAETVWVNEEPQVVASFLVVLVFFGGRAVISFAIGNIKEIRGISHTKLK